MKETRMQSRRKSFLFPVEKGILIPGVKYRYQKALIIMRGGGLMSELREGRYNK